MSGSRLLVLLALCVGCDDSMDCTNAGCLEGFAISVSATPEPERVVRGALEPDAGGEVALPAGDYEIDLSLDGARVSCRGSLPDTEPFRCDAGALQLALAKPMTQDADRPTTGFQLQVVQHPRSVSAVVRYQGSVVAQGQFQPTYQTFEPNGPGCGSCRSARAERLLLAF